MSLSDDDVNYYVDDGWLDESCCVGSTMSQSLDGSGCDDSQDYGSQPLPEPLPALTEDESALLEARALVANCKREAVARKEKIVQQAMQAKKDSGDEWLDLLLLGTDRGDVATKEQAAQLEAIAIEAQQWMDKLDNVKEQHIHTFAEVLRKKRSSEQQDQEQSSSSSSSNKRAALM